MGSHETLPQLAMIRNEEMKQMLDEFPVAVDVGVEMAELPSNAPSA